MTENSTQVTCPRCPNHCSADAVQCRRGAEYFGLTKSIPGADVPKSSMPIQAHTGHEDHKDHDGYGEHGSRREHSGHRERGCQTGSHGPHPHIHNQAHGPHGNHAETPPSIRDFEPDTQEGKLAAQLRGCGHYLYHNGLPKASQLRILYILSANGSMSQRLLQDVLGVKPGSLSEILGKLENAGYIARSKNEQDKRGVDIVATEEGRQAVSALKSQHEAAMHGMFGALDSQEQQQLSALLEKLLAAWRTCQQES